MSYDARSYADKSAVIFDLDGTLTPSKRQVEKDMAALFCRLLRSGKKVVVMSGGIFSRFKSQFLDHLTCADSAEARLELFKDLYLFPLDGSTFYLYQGEGWKEIYSEPFSVQEKTEIFSAIKKAETDVPGLGRGKIYGDTIEDRGSQITFSALGQQAPLTEKLRWDRDHSKRIRMELFLRPLLKNYDVKIGGTTSIDVNKRHINKAYAIRKMEEYSGIPISEMLFIGDAIFKGGNDYQALETGVDHVKVNGPEDTAKVIRQVLGMSE